MINYDKYHIYELRNMARDKGIKSPTTLKRAELIESLIKIENGELQPIIKTTRGRPAKILNIPKTIVYEERDKALFVNVKLSSFITLLESIKNFNISINNQIDDFIINNKDILK